MLYGLSVEKHAHWQFRILSRSTRIPVRSLLFSCFCMLIGTLLLFLVPNVMTCSPSSRPWRRLWWCSAGDDLAAYLVLSPSASGPACRFDL